MRSFDPFSKVIEALTPIGPISGASSRRYCICSQPRDSSTSCGTAATWSLRSCVPRAGRVEPEREAMWRPPQHSGGRTFPAQLEHFLAQLLDLLTLLTGRQIRPQATVSLSLAHTLAQRLRVHPMILGDVRDRPARLHRQPHTALHQLIWVPPGSWHPRRVPCPEDRSSSIRSLRETRPSSHLQDEQLPLA